MIGKYKNYLSATAMATLMGAAFIACTPEKPKEDPMENLLLLGVVASSATPESSCTQNVGGCGSDKWSCATATKCYSSKADCAKSNECPVTTNASPTVRMKNITGGTEIYGIYTASNCSGTPVADFGSVNNGVTTSYKTVTAAGYAIAYGLPAATYCLAGPFTFNNNKTYTCTSDPSTMTCVIP
jgi:hypothetical protein